MYRSVLVAVAGVVVLAVVLAGRSPAAAAVSCDRSATPSTFAAQVAAATAGQTICLASGSYGTWSGTSKAITVIAADGAAPTMQVSFGSGDAGFTLDGMRAMGGAVSGGSDITIRNSTFTSSIDFSGTGISGVVLDGNSLAWNSTGVCCKITVNNTNGTVADPAVTLRNNDIRNGESDGVQVREGAKGLVILNNTFANLCDIGANHTDNIQHYGSGITQNRIAGNYFFASASCDTQGITSYDGGTVGVIIEDNVLDIRRPWAIELYADKNSIVRHNTLRWYAAGNCAFNIACGQIDINRKSGDAAGSGTQAYDNLTTGVEFSNGSTGTQHHNISAQQASYVGPLTSYAGFKLASNSPVGRNAASDGLDAGARITTTPTATLLPISKVPPPAIPDESQAPSLPSLVAAFDFDERSGSTVVDHSGLGNHGKLRGARRTNAGKHGRALTFDGINDYVRVPDSASLDLSTGMTLEAWVRPTTRTGRRGAILKQRSRRLSYGLYTNDQRGRISGRIRTTGIRATREQRTRGGARLRRNQWSHIAATYNGSTLRVYRNGSLTTTRTIHGPITANNGPLTIGGHPALDHWFKGKIDNVRIWRTPRTTKAIRAAMRARKAATSNRSLDLPRFGGHGVVRRPWPLMLQ